MKIPKLSNLLQLRNANMNQLNMYKMKLKLANQEIQELKSTIKVVEKNYLTITNVSFKLLQTINFDLGTMLSRRKLQLHF